MTSLIQVKRFFEGTDILGEVQNDTRDAQSTDLATRTAAWNDISAALPKSQEALDLYTDPYSINRDFVTGVQNNMEAYFQGMPVTVEAFDGNGDTNLIFGATGSTTPTTVWDCVIAPQAPFTVTYNSDWEEFGSSDTFSAVWGSIPATNLYHDEDKDENGIILSDYNTICASGTAAQWEPFMHIHGGDATALNESAFLG